MVSLLMLLCIDLDLSNINSFPFFKNRLQLGAILNIHKFFRVLPKPLTWVIYYSVVHFIVMVILAICDSGFYYTNPNVATATVRIIIFYFQGMNTDMQGVFLFAFAPIMILVAIALSGYGALILTVVRKSLQVSGPKGKGFYRKTLLMILTLAGFVVMCVVDSISAVSNVSLIQVFSSISLHLICVTADL